VKDVGASIKVDTALAAKLGAGVDYDYLSIGAGIKIYW
jgi:hypothetical protein